MNKFMKHSLINIIFWVLSFIFIFIIIICKLNDELDFQIFKFIFTILFLFSPFLLSTYNVWIFNKFSDDKNIFKVTPFIGMMCFTTLSFINLFKNLNDSGKVILLITILFLYLINIFCIIYLLKKENNLRRHTLVTILSLVFFVIFNVVGTYVSYYYSLMW